MGELEVQEGAFATLNPDIFPRLARRSALHVQRILIGDDAGQLNTSFSAGERLFINMATAREIGVYLPLEISLEADLINEQPPDITKNYSIGSAVNEGINANLALASKQASVKSEASNIGLVRFKSAAAYRCKRNELSDR